MINFLKKCPLTAAIIVTFVLLNILSGIAIYNETISCDDLSISHPPVASIFEYASDEWKNRETTVADASSPQAKRSFDVSEFTETGKTEEASQNMGEEAYKSDSVSAEDYTEASKEDAKPDGYGEVAYVERASGKPRSGYYDEVNVKALSTQFDYSTVDDNFFSDTLIIGDSRIEGLCRYGGIDTAEYCYKTGATVWNLKETDMLDGHFEKTTLDKALEKNKYSFIYIMLGINELGKGTPASFAQQYSEDISYIRQSQPQAVIVIMGILGITESYSDSNDVFNNDNVNARNVAISHLSNGSDIFYLNVNEAVCDENDAMTEEYSRDGIHLKAEYYTLWADYLRTHAIVK
jgi:hypothetical protein